MKKPSFATLAVHGGDQHDAGHNAAFPLFTPRVVLFKPISNSLLIMATHEWQIQRVTLTKVHLLP